MVDLSQLNLNDTAVEESHEFEVDIACVVIANHGYALEAIQRSEEQDIANVRHSLAGEDWDFVNSEIRRAETFYEDLRRSANRLAVVGLVTRLQHWTSRFAKRAKIGMPARVHQSQLLNQMEALNKLLGHPMVDVTFFKELVDVRDSVVHANSQAEWEYPKGCNRQVAQHYRGPWSEVEFSPEQLKEAIVKTIQQVKWYDENIRAEGPLNG